MKIFVKGSEEDIECIQEGAEESGLMFVTGTVQNGDTSDVIIFNVTHDEADTLISIKELCEAQSMDNFYMMSIDGSVEDYNFYNGDPKYIGRMTIGKGLDNYETFRIKGYTFFIK